jgi:hypothetical protein
MFVHSIIKYLFIKSKKFRYLLFTAIRLGYNLLQATHKGRRGMYPYIITAKIV